MVQESAFMICSNQNKRLIPLLSLGRLFSFITYPSEASSLSSIHLRFRLKSNQDSTSSTSIFTFKVQSTKIIPRKREYAPCTHESTSFQCASSLASFFQQYSWCSSSQKFLRTGIVEGENSTLNSKRRCKQITPRLIFLEWRTTHISSVHTWTSSLWWTSRYSQVTKNFLIQCANWLSNVLSIFYPKVQAIVIPTNLVSTRSFSKLDSQVLVPISYPKQNNLENTHTQLRYSTSWQNWSIPHPHGVSANLWMQKCRWEALSLRMCARTQLSSMSWISRWCVWLT